MEGDQSADSELTQGAEMSRGCLVSSFLSCCVRVKMAFCDCIGKDGLFLVLFIVK